MADGCTLHRPHPAFGPCSSSMPGISDIDSFIERAEELTVGGEHGSTLLIAALPLVFVRLVVPYTCVTMSS
jgi:hypothetical protein